MTCNNGGGDILFKCLKSNLITGHVAWLDKVASEQSTRPSHHEGLQLH